MARDHLVIVGAGMACALLLESLDKGGFSGPITVISEESHACYNRVLLSSWLAGTVKEEDLQMFDPTATSLNIEWIYETAVDNLDMSAGSVVLSSGEQLDFDRLVFATGAEPAVPANVPLSLQGVETFRTRDDARRLLDQQSQSLNVAVLGGGLLGLEAAEGMRAMGCETTLIHRHHRLMNRQLDLGGSEALAAELRSRGMCLRLGATVDRVESVDGRCVALCLDDGSRIQTDLLIIATGIRPRVHIARRAGLPVNHGIVVDPSLCVSGRPVYALGECCEVDGETFGMVTPIRSQALVLARVLCGEKARFEHESPPVQLKISDIELFAVGESSSAASIGVSDEAQGVYRRLYFENGRLAGAVLLGDVSGGAVYEALISAAASVDPHDMKILFDPQPIAPLVVGEAQAA
ncbi:MAG: FAD-dependent oxidoreductase [Pseudomonadota bacterium]